MRSETSGTSATGARSAPGKEVAASHEGQGLALPQIVWLVSERDVTQTIKVPPLGATTYVELPHTLRSKEKHHP